MARLCALTVLAIRSVAEKTNDDGYEQDDCPAQNPADDLQEFLHAKPLCRLRAKDTSMRHPQLIIHLLADPPMRSTRASAARFLASHPSANYALGWGTRAVHFSISPLFVHRLFATRSGELRLDLGGRL
jgi:hypothetical protein